MFGLGREGGMSSSSNALCEYRAGKFVLKRDEATGKQFMHADKRPGLIRVKREESDGLVHFQWLKRGGGVMGAPTTYTLEDDLILFPDEAVMKRSAQGGSESRVFLLKFKQGDRKLYFWFQEESKDEDEAFVKKVNVSLNGTAEDPTEQKDTESVAKKEGGEGGSGSGAGAGEGGGEPPSAGDKGKEEEGGEGDSGAVPMDTGATGGEGQQKAAAEPGAAAELSTHPLDDLTSGVSQEALAAALLAAAGSVHPPSGPSLAEVLKPETIVPLLRNRDIQERLAEYLPQEHRHEEAILELASSPQFQQQLETFSEALQSGQLNLNAFGIPHSALTVADFLKSIQTMSSAEEGKGGETDKGGEAEK